MKIFKVPLGESNIEWEKETEESLYDRLAYNIHMPQVEFNVKIITNVMNLMMMTG